MFSDKKMNQLFIVETIRFYGPDLSFGDVSNPATVPVSGFWRENPTRPTSIASMFSKFLPQNKRPCIEIEGNRKVHDQGCILVVVGDRFLPLPEYLTRLFVRYEITHCPAAKRTVFTVYCLMRSVSTSKFLELVPVVDKDPQQIQARLQQTRSESQLQNSTRRTLI